MDRILNELLSDECNAANDRWKINILNETLEEASKKDTNNDIVDDIMIELINKLKTNDHYVKVVNEFVNKYVNDESKEDARERLYYILSKELLGVCSGLSNTRCSIM